LLVSPWAIFDLLSLVPQSHPCNPATGPPNKQGASIDLVSQPGMGLGRRHVTSPRPSPGGGRTRAKKTSIRHALTESRPSRRGARCTHTLGRACHVIAL